MIIAQPYRRLRLESDGCDQRPSLPGLACHKGDAAETQSSQQTGAQTGGSVVTGDQNKTITASDNTNSPVASYELNLSGSTGGSSGIFGDGGSSTVNNVTLTDNGALALAANETQAALDAVGSATAAAQAQNQTLTQSIASTESTLADASNSVQSIVKEAVAYGALAACGFFAFKIFKT